MQNDDSELPERDALPPKELHDVTIAATAMNAIEALGLVDLLEESGIPAMSRRSGLIYFGSLSGTDILVPRVHVVKARRIVEEFRTNATEKSVVDSFKKENIDEQLNDTQREPLIDRLRELSFSEKEVRDIVLLDLLADWIAADTSDIQIANYLAISGCTPSEANELLVKVLTINSSKLKTKLKTKIRICCVIAVLGLFCTIFSGGSAFAAMALVCGLGFAFRYNANLKALN